MSQQRTSQQRTLTGPCIRLLLLSFLSLGLFPVSTSAPASADEPLPVEYNFFGGFSAELTTPGGSPAGSNEWNCVPTKEHPEPIVLVHGTGAGAQTNWGTYAPLLKNEGYCVFALTYGNLKNAPWPINSVGGLGFIEESAAELAVFIDKILDATRAKKVNIIGHSQGTFMPTYYAKFLGGEDKIEKYISLAPLWRGSQAGDSINALQSIPAKIVDILSSRNINIECKACFQMNQNSELIESLYGASPYLPNITYTNIMTRYDEVVVPYSSGYVEAENATNIVVQDFCPLDFSEHAALAASPIAAAYVLNALDPAHARPVPCEFVPPFTG
ncbi:MAG: esterase/lipase family protein [Mycobacteriaceae bacterium]